MTSVDPSPPSASRSGRWWTVFLSVIPWLTAVVFLLPVVVGLLGTWLPAWGYFPALGENTLSLTAWRQWAAYPGVETAVRNTLISGLGASLFALGLLLLILTGLYPSRLFQWIEKALSPILSVPHAAFAIGLGFLIAPSGWLLRMTHGLTGAFENPPLFISFQDPLGLSLAFTLALKELPFLLFMSLAVLPSLKIHKTLWLMRGMSFSRRATWLWILWPQLYRQIKLPFFAVIAYSLTVVDIALIGGPTTPPTLAVMVTRMFNDPDLSLRLAGAAGATALFAIVMLVLTLVHFSEYPLRVLRNRQLRRGRRLRSHRSPETPVAAIMVSLTGLVYLLGFSVTVLWSLTHRWQYPDWLPSSLSLRSWSRVTERIDDPFWYTLLLASLASLTAIVLVILALENEVRLKQQNRPVNTRRVLWLLYLPLLIPQVAFIFGFQVSLISLRWDGTFTALLWSHLVFVLPYVFLTLSGPYRRFDERYAWVARTLASGPLSAYWRVKFPMLLRAILYAFATGFSVSIAQYLPTLFVGAGRYATLTTEAVAMATGSDRRMMAVMALWQQSLPLIIFAVATLLPAFYFRNRKEMTQS